MPIGSNGHSRKRKWQTWELRDAQLHPEKYENLQVRVCGWNVRWNDLTRAEQDAYIRRAENVMKGW